MFSYFIAYNLASAVFGGPAPLIQTALVMKVKDEGEVSYFENYNKSQ